MTRLRSLLALLALAGTGCTTLHRPTGTTADVLGSPTPPDRVTLTLRDGKKLDMWQAGITGDSIIGYSHPQGAIMRTRRAEATGDVTDLQVRKFSVASTMMVVIGIAGVGFALSRVSKPTLKPLY